MGSASAASSPLAAYPSSATYPPSAAYPPSGQSAAPPDGGSVHLDGKDFFRQARLRLTYEQFNQAAEPTTPAYTRGASTDPVRPSLSVPTCRWPPALA